MVYGPKQLTLLLCIVGSPVFGQTIATWSGNGNNVSFSEATNWSTGQVPIDSDDESFRVIVGEDVSVQFDVSGTGHEISQLEMASDSTLLVESGRDVAVVESASLAGTVRADSGAFSDKSPTATTTATSQFVASNGGTIAVGASSYIYSGNGTSEFLRATGTGSVIGFPRLQTLESRSSRGNSSIIARNQGKLNLPSVVSLGALGDQDSLYVQAETLGSIDLNGLLEITATDESTVTLEVANGGNISMPELRRISGAVQFKSDGTPWELPKLESIRGPNSFDSPPGTEITLPSLRQMEGTSDVRSNIAVPVGGSFVASELKTMNHVDVQLSTNATLDVPELLTFDSGEIVIEGGAALNAPSLTEFTNSRLTIDRTSSADLSSLVNIDNSVLRVDGGRTLRIPALKYVDSRGVFRSDNLVASGTGTEFDLSTITYLSQTSSVRASSAFAARNGGLLNLSGVTQVVGGDFEASLNGVIDLTGLTDLQANRTSFEAKSGGVILMPNIQATSGTCFLSVSDDAQIIAGNLDLNHRSSITLDSPDANLVMNGNLFLRGWAEAGQGAGLSMMTNSRITLKSDFIYQHTNANSFDITEGVFDVTGSGIQFLEIGGSDLGATESDEFSMGRLVVGSEEQPTTLMLLDLYDNGNRNGESPEALYLNGIGDLDGLQIFPGSKVVLNGFNAYAFQEGAWVHVNSLFEDGQREIEFAGGIVSIPEPVGYQKFLIFPVVWIIRISNQRRKKRCA